MMEIENETFWVTSFVRMFMDRAFYGASYGREPSTLHSCWDFPNFSVGFIV